MYMHVTFVDSSTYDHGESPTSYVLFVYTVSVRLTCRGLLCFTNHANQMNYFSSFYFFSIAHTDFFVGIYSL